MDRLQIKPTSQTLIAMQTWALSRTGRQDEAIKAVAALWTAPGNSAEAWIAAMRISGVLPDRMDPREAIKTFTIATPQTRGYLAGFEADAWALLGETSVAVDRWDRAAGDVPTWVTPIIRLAEYRARSGEIDTALDLAKQAFGRSPRRAVGTLLNTWAGAIEVGESQDIPTLRSLLDELIRTNPDQPELLAIRMAILAADNQQGAAIEAGKQLLALPKERLTGSVILRIAGVSAIRKLGLEQIALDRYKADFGMTLAYADVAASITALAKAPADGLALVREMIASPEHVTAPLEGQSQADVARAWRFLEARWAEVARDPGAGQLWIALADSMPDDVGTQRTALDMVSTRTDTDFQTRAIERLRSLTGEQATAWKLATARSLVAKGNLDSSTLDRAAALLEAVVSSSPKSVEAQFLLARVREASGSTAKAQEHYRAASRLAPDNLLIQVALARLLQTRGDFSGAGLVLDRVLDLREVDAQQARLVAGVLAAQGDSNRAIDLLRDNATGASSDDEMLLAALYRRQGDLERAIAICQRIADGPDNNLGVLTLAADCYAAMGKMDQANAVLDRVSSLKLDPGIPELARAEFAAKHRSATEALEWSRKAVEAGSANENAWRSLLAQLVMAGQGQELKGAIERATQAVPESKAIAEIRKQADMLASATSDSRRRDLAIAFVTNATDPAVRDQLESASRLSAGNTTTYYSTSSLARLRQVADRYPLSMPVQLNMLRQYAAANRLADAASIAARAVESFPTSAEIAELALRAHALSGQWSQVAHYADALRRRAPARSIEADSWAATAALRTGDPQRAVVLLDPHKKEFLVKPDAHADSITLYATVLVAANRPDDARQWISTLLKASQPTRARWLATASSDFPTAFAIDQVELIAAMPDNADLVNAEVATAFHRLASRTKDQSLESRSKEVRDRTAQVAATAPAMLVLAGLASDQSEPQMAIGLYRKVLATVDDDNELAQVAKNNLAMLLLTENQLPEAHALAASAVARRPSSPDYSDTLGRVLLAMGKPVDATGPFRLAAELDSDRPSRAIPLLEALVATADPAAIKEARTRLTTITPESLSDQERAKLEQVRTALNPPR
jgi:predicted Zn-dependent protease